MGSDPSQNDISEYETLPAIEATHPDELAETVADIASMHHPVERSGSLNLRVRFLQIRASAAIQSSLPLEQQQSSLGVRQQIQEINRRQVMEETPTQGVSVPGYIEELSPSLTRTLRARAVIPQSQQQVNIRLKLLKLVIIFAVALLSTYLITGRSLNNPINWYTTIVWCLYLPIALVGLFAAIRGQKIFSQPFIGAVSNRVNFAVVTLARHDVLPALMRSIDSVLYTAPRHLTDWQIFVVFEEGAEGKAALEKYYITEQRGYIQFGLQRRLAVRLIEVPKSYQTQNSTKYKARAAQYLLELLRQETQPEVAATSWYYQFDDDTGVGFDTIWSLAATINRDNRILQSGKQPEFHLAQGVLTYPFQLSKSWLTRWADGIRPADDLTSFAATTGGGTPLFGAHGEHLFIRLSILSEISWDFGRDEKVEDSRFALTFSSRYPGKSTFLPSCSYGASPESVSDFIKQRRRWAAGILKLVTNKKIPLRYRFAMGYRMGNWIIGLFQHPLFVLLLAVIAMQFNTSPINPVFVFVWSFNYSYQIWLYLEGLRINLEASQESRRWPFILYPIPVILLMPVFALMEAVPAVLGFWDFIRKVERFVVIRKTDAS